MTDEIFIKIPVRGEDKDKVEAEFWAWFLDGGGAQSFTQSVELDADYTVYEKFDHDDRAWTIQTHRRSTIHQAAEDAMNEVLEEWK